MMTQTCVSCYMPCLCDVWASSAAVREADKEMKSNIYCYVVVAEMKNIRCEIVTGATEDVMETFKDLFGGTPEAQKSVLVEYRCDTFTNLFYFYLSQINYSFICELNTILM